MIIAEIAAFLLSGLMLLRAGWALYISLDYRKEKTSHTNAWLSKTEYEKNMSYHDKQGHYIHCYTKVWYTYTVDGTRHTIEEGVKNANPGNFSNRVKVVYQRKRSDRAYIENWTYPSEPVQCFAFSFLGLVFLALGLGLLLS